MWLRLAFEMSVISLAAMEKDEWHGMHRKTVHDRIQLLRERVGLRAEHVDMLERSMREFEGVQALSENVIGMCALPLSIAPHFVINGKCYVVPMVTEEKTVVAAASYGALLARAGGGFTARAPEPVASGQLVFTHVPDIVQAQTIIVQHKNDLVAHAQKVLGSMIARGGGMVDLTVHVVNTFRGDMLVVELFVNTCDAMGANVVTRVAEHLAPKIACLTGGTALMGVVNNVCVQRVVRARAVWPRAVLGDVCIARIVDAYACACADAGRCATHNKGIMNGIDAVALATGNDFRALEAGAHVYAALGHAYQPLTRYTINEAGDLVGEIEVPLVVGTVGGAIARHPCTTIALEILQVHSATELAQVMACVGLAQNLAALRALVSEGISHAFKY